VSTDGSWFGEFVKRTFEQEHVPDPEHRGPGQGPGVGAEEPLGHVEHGLHLLPLLRVVKKGVRHFEVERKKGGLTRWR